MSTFLQIAKMAARECGTISGDLPTTTAGQTGRLGKVVNWVITAWNDIQNDRASWKWMQGEFTAAITAGTQRYTAASFSLTRWAEWLPCDITIYKTSLGRADENRLGFLEWAEFKRRYDIGVPAQDRPAHYAFSPAGEICLGPVPDAAYTLRGPYRKSPQQLANDADVPEMPAQFHDLIAWKALLLLAEHDEANLQIAVAVRRDRQLTADLERDQLPQVQIGSAPIA